MNGYVVDGLHQPPFGHGGYGLVPDNEVVQHAHVHQRQGLGQLQRNLPVGLARLGDAGGVVVGEDDGCCIQLQAALDHLARVHAGAVDGAGEQNLVADDAVAVVQEQAGEHLVLEAAQPGPEVVLGLVRVAQHRAGAQFRLQVATGQLKRRLEPSRQGLAERRVPGVVDEASDAPVLAQLLAYLVERPGRCKEADKFGIG